jgi:hypothetical protein
MPSVIVRAATGGGPMVLVERMQALGDHARAGRWRGDERPEEKEERQEKQDSAARRAVIHEWENWAALNPDDLADPAAGAFFFSHLQQKKPELLNFLSDDKWQTISAWLPRQGHVRD